MITNFFIALVICLLIPPLGALWQVLANVQAQKLKDQYTQARIQSTYSMMESRRLDQILKAQRQVEQGNKGVITDLRIDELKLKIQLLERELGKVSKGDEFHPDDY